MPVIQINEASHLVCSSGRFIDGSIDANFRRRHFQLRLEAAEPIITRGCVIPHGKGQIVLYCLPQLVRSLQPGDFAISPVIAQRLLGNALRPAVNEK